MNPRCSLLLRKARSSRRSPRGVRRLGKPRRILHTTWIGPLTSDLVSCGTLERRLGIDSRAGKPVFFFSIHFCRGNDKRSCRELFVFMQIQIAGPLNSFSTSRVFSNAFIAGRSRQSPRPAPSIQASSFFSSRLHSRLIAPTLESRRALRRR